MSQEGEACDTCVADAYKQLDGALCLWSRAKGETVQEAYFEGPTSEKRILRIGDLRVAVTITAVDEPEKEATDER